MMTRDEIIERLRQFELRHADPGAEYSEFWREAISALEATQEPCDTISREAVVEAIDKWYENNRGEAFFDDYIEDLIIAVTYLPPVQPSQKEQEIKYWIDYYGHVTPLVQPSRKGHWKEYIHSAYHGVDEYDEPIWREVTVYHCSECNRRTVIKEHFCPNCGASMADMRGAE